MYKNLDNYLQEIDHYLAVDKGGEEILSEIRSHIIEKTEHEFGEVNDQTLDKTISGYGSPRSIAEKYLEDFQIISPSFKKHLFRYTWLVFACHFTFGFLSMSPGGVRASFTYTTHSSVASRPSVSVTVNWKVSTVPFFCTVGDVNVGQADRGADSTTDVPPV